MCTGKIASTETTYKYHMQIQEDSVDKGAKFRDVPLKTLLKPSKSRLSDTNSVQVNPPSNTETHLSSAGDQQPTATSDESNAAQ
jgi:hypothetical protein